MQQNRQIRFELSAGLYEEIKSHCPDGQMSEFIRQAMVEKLNRKKISQDEMYHRFKKIDKLDTESVRKTVVDVEFTAQVIYEEIKKQNEILKLILRRSTFASGFSSNTFAEIAKSEQELEEVKGQLANVIDEDLKQLKF